SPKHAAENYVCPICNLDIKVLPASSSTQTTTQFSEPVAIEFFHLYQFILKSQKDGIADSFPEKLKRKDGQQTIYRLMDQRGYYDAAIKPQLNSLNIKTIQANLTDSIITFIHNKQTYSVSINFFKENDGVIFFKPGKKPIVWSSESLPENCTDAHIITSYFKN
ncbi:MAG: hypothetical protein ACRCYO_14605, partial [Bacteroidia bacterium]